MPPGEVIVLIEIIKVKDPEGLEQYQAAAREQIAARGARVIGRGGDSYFGEPRFGKLVVQLWPSEEAFRGWQDSVEYQPLRSGRLQAADIRIAIIPMV